MSAPRNPGYSNSTTKTVNWIGGSTTREVRRSILVKSHAVTPNYYGLRNSGARLPELAYSMRKEIETYDLVPASNSLTNFDKGAFTGAFWAKNGSPVFGDPTAEANAKAIQQLFGNISPYRSNVAVTVAELPRTISLIGDTASRLARMVRSLKRFDIPGAFNAIGLSSEAHRRRLIRKARALPRNNKSRADFASSSILELQYGWRPLLSEVDNAMHDLAERFKTRSDMFRVLGGSEASGSIPARSIQYVQPSARLVYMGNVVNTSQVGYVCYVKVTDAGKFTQGGMGNSPLDVAWELIPYSFIADWFIPIGSWISSLTALSGLAFLDGSKSVLRKIEYTNRYYGHLTTSPAIRFRNEKRSLKSVSMTRSKLVAFPSGFSMLRVKGLDKILGTEHAINAIALLTQAVKGNKADRY